MLLWLALQAPFIFGYWVYARVRFRLARLHIEARVAIRDLKREVERRDRLRNPHKYRLAE
jgi:hypothetical protein